MAVHRQGQNRTMSPGVQMLFSRIVTIYVDGNADMQKLPVHPFEIRIQIIQRAVNFPQTCLEAAAQRLAASELSSSLYHVIIGKWKKKKIPA
jgi:hypothetical protein